MLSPPVLSALLLASSAAAGSSKYGRRDLLVTDSVRAACDQLSAIASNATLFPNSTAYETQRINFWDKRANLSPACIYMPSTADDVAKAVQIFHANKAPFAVKGGGHMNYPGSNTIDDGILLALNGLNARKVNADNNNIEVGPGNKWVDVYQELAPYGKYAIGGRLKTIGVPGLTLIGGVSYFLNKYGFFMDNVLSYDVVLGNGTQVVADNTTNTELFWALKGGGSNFGIVTKFTLKTYDIPLVTSTLQTFPQDAIPDFIKAACDMVLSEDGSVGAGAVINMNYNMTTKETNPQVFGLQETTESPPSRFANFTAIPNAITRVHNDVADVEGLRPTYILNLLPASALTPSKTNGIGNTFGLEDDQPYIWWQFTTAWARAEDDLRMTAWHESLLAHHHEINKAKGLATEFIYMGDAGEFQKPLPQYGAANVERMRSVRDQYDPDLTFTKLSWGGFKLGY
ncbi:hypothetical protein K4K61_010244 [Colletotrichum sp. SAR11_59]|nr:hypothetical protein K4K61_010244 [Colletotrichum sp. SAR11_59]